MLHSAIVHHEQNNIRLRSANLKPETPTFRPHRSRGAPACAIVATAYRESAAFLRAENESGLFHARNDHDAMRLIDQILGDAFIGSPHHVGQRVGRSVQPVVDLDCSVRRESGSAHGTGNRQNSYECVTHRKMSSFGSIESTLASNAPEARQRSERSFHLNVAAAEDGAE